MGPWLARFDRDIKDGYALGPVRVVLGVLLGLQALHASEDRAVFGYFGDAFHVALIPEALVPSASFYALLLALRVCLAVMVIVGVRARPALAASALLAGWILLCDRLQIDDGRYSLVGYAFLVSLTPCDGSWRATSSAVPQPRTGPFWAVRVGQLQVSLVFLAAGAAKLLDPDWRSGLVLADLLTHPAAPALGVGIPHALVLVLARPDAASALGKLAIMSELVVGVALWLRPTRVVALWWAVWLQIVVAGLSPTPASALLTIVVLGLFATPDHHARSVCFDPSRLWGRTTGTLVPLLDWFGRFEVKAWEPDDQPGHSLVVVRRDGERVTGIRALAMLARCLPILFPLWAPLALLASFTRQGDLSSAS